MRVRHSTFLLFLLSFSLLLSCRSSRISSKASSFNSSTELKNLWQPLFNHKNLNGWNVLPGGEWRVTRGVIVGTSPSTEHLHGILISDKIYGDFKLKIIYKAIKGNSGVYFRVEKVNHPAQVFGLQAEIDPDKDAGGLYETGGRDWVVQPTPTNVKKWYKPNEWNEMIIIAKSKDVAVYLNGYKTAELKDDPGRTKGYIGLQLHGRMEMNVLFKDILIIEDPKDMEL